MKVHRLSQLGTGTVIVLASVCLSAQTDPMSGQPSSPQTSRQQQQPGSATGRRGDPGAQDATGDPGASADMMRDKMFLRKASKGNFVEVTFGQLAMQKGGSDEVRDFGRKMVTDHTALKGELQPFAETSGILTPKKLTPKDETDYDKLMALSGDDFDKAYLSFVVKQHHEDLSEFRNEAETTTDPSLREVVDKGSKMIHEHMRVGDALARSRGVGLPGRFKTPPVPTTP